MNNKKYFYFVTAILAAIFLIAQFSQVGRIVSFIEVDQAEALFKIEILESNPKNQSFFCVSLENVAVPVLCCLIYDLIKDNSRNFCPNQINYQKILNHSPPYRYNFIA
ncbi:MAG: hypothetical protein PHV17_08045 [Candidatus Omnitrophica bacterium]|nr:hypothetical protein [Candidatus Omnitrophota bacterium]